MPQSLPNPIEFLRSGFVFALRQDDFLIGWGEWRKSSSAAGDCSVYAPDFYLTSPQPWLLPEHFAVVTREFFTTHVLPKMTTEVKPLRWVEPLREGFENQVRLIRGFMAEGQLEKAVPVVHAQAREIMTDERLQAILRALAQAPNSLIPSGFWRPGEGLLGATPERLFTIGDDKISTMALAGTRAKRSADDARALFEDPKERHEHQLVIDDIIARLSVFGEVEVGETVVAELPTLFHLKTAISVRGTASFDQLATALHPTPALGVSPRAFGLANMRKWDDVSLRARYGAPLGVVVPSLGLQECLVAIRNIQWRADEIKLGSGCGFVRESDVDREWNELALKRESVKKVLKL